MEEGVDYLLACDIISVAPVQNLKVKWYYGSEVTQIQTFSKTSAVPVNVSSTFNVTAKREHNGERFRCEAELDLGPNGPQPLPLVAAEAPSPAVVQCEFSTFFFVDVFHSDTLVHFDLFLLYQINRPSKVVQNTTVDWRTHSVWIRCPVMWMGTLQPPFSGIMRAK